MYKEARFLHPYHGIGASLSAQEPAVMRETAVSGNDESELTIRDDELLDDPLSKSLPGNDNDSEGSTEPSDHPMTGKPLKSVGKLLYRLPVLLTLILLLFLAGNIALSAPFGVLTTSGNPASLKNLGTTLKHRRDALNAALHVKSRENPFFHEVQAEDILTLTQRNVFKNGVDTGLFQLEVPSSVEVYVGPGRPDQLFVTIPNDLIPARRMKKTHFGVSRGDQKPLNANWTQLTEGVIHIALDPKDAYGFINVQLLNPPFTDTSIIVDLGSRFMQRVGKAAARFKQPIDQIIQQHAAPMKCVKLYFNATLTRLCDMCELAQSSAMQTSKSATSACERVEQQYRNAKGWLLDLPAVFSQHIRDADTLVNKSAQEFSTGTRQYLLGRLSHAGERIAKIKSFLKRATSTAGAAHAIAARNARGIFHRFILHSPPTEEKKEKQESSLMLYYCEGEDHMHHEF